MLLINYAPIKKKRLWEACCLERADWVIVSGWRTKRGKAPSRRALGVGQGKETALWSLLGSQRNRERSGLQLPRKVKKEPAEELGSGICTSNSCSCHPVVTTHLALGVQLALALQSCSWELTGWDSDKTRGSHLQHMGRRGINWTFRL